MPAKKKISTLADLCFEEAIEQLEGIVTRMEGERVPLDSLLKDYDEGTRLLQHCRGRIEDARARIETINNELTAAANDDNDDAADDAHPDEDIQLL